MTLIEVMVIDMLVLFFSQPQFKQHSVIQSLFSERDWDKRHKKKPLYIRTGFHTAIYCSLFAARFRKETRKAISSPGNGKGVNCLFPVVWPTSFAYYLLHSLFFRPLEGGTTSCKQNVDILYIKSWSWCQQTVAKLIVSNIHWFRIKLTLNILPLKKKYMVAAKSAPFTG